MATNTRNFNKHLKFAKQEKVLVTIIETTYECPLYPPAILGINLDMIQAHPEMSESDAEPLLREAVDSVYGDKAYDEWKKWMPNADIVNLLYYARYGYDDNLFDALDAKTQPEDDKSPQIDAAKVETKE